MGQSMQLSQKMALSQVLAPQLQQSLALLQAPTLELKALVEQELEQNPVLEEIALAEMDQEEKTIRGETDVPDQADPAEPPQDMQNISTAEKVEPVEDFQAEFERLSQLDQEWREHFSQTNTPLRQSAEDDEKRQYMFDSIVAGTSLQETLLEQVRLSELNEEEQQIAEMLIGNIDDRGYLRATVDELAFSTNIPKDSIERVLRVVQSFHPPGVAARDLCECLKLQLERLGKKETIEYRMLCEHMDALGKRRLPEISRALGLGVDQVQEAVGRIALLEPEPGRSFLPDNQMYVVPEIFVSRTEVGDYIVSTNNDQVPHLRISNAYKDLMSQAESSGEVREWIREKIRAGKFLIKSLHQRQETILNIAREIVNRQKEFLEKGVSHLKPMTMVQVAEVVGVHETTVSRAVSGKYMQTPRGVFEMKYFFTSGLKTSNGDGMSNTSVKEMINEMVANEDSSKPLSDEEIVRRLTERGIQIARRTVAKYRAELDILPSHLRKQY